MQLPKLKTQYLRAEDFQCNETILTYLDFDQKGNFDVVDESGAIKRKAKDVVKFQLSRSYPEWAIDKDSGEKRLDKNGNPFRNQYWDAKFPMGWTPLYKFEEGDLECSSKPFYELMMRLQPSEGDRISILRTGKDKETKWFVKRVGKAVSMANDVPELDVDEFGATTTLPF